MRHYLRRWQGLRSWYDRLTWLGIVVLLAITVIVEVAMPFAAWSWSRRPFPGLLFEHTLIVSDLRSPGWGVDLLQVSLPRLVAIDGQAVPTDRDLARILDAHRLGDRLTLTLERQDGGTPVTVSTVLQRFPLADWLTMFVLPYVVGLIYLLLGVWVFRLRGDQRPGQSFAFFCAMVALATGTLFDISTSHTFVRVWTMALPLTAAALIHLALVFPEEGSLIRRWPAARFVPYAFAFGLALVSELRLYSAANPWAYVLPWRYSYLGVGMALVAFFVLMLYSRARTLSPIVRQQVRIILIGSLLAFGPVLVFLGLAGLAFAIPFQESVYLPALVIFPVAVAYAILRYRLLGMDLVASRGLAYTILILTVGGTYLLAAAVLSQTLNVNLLHGRGLLLAVLAGLLVLLIPPLRRGVEHLADKLLGWRRYDYRQALQAYSRELATTPLDLPAILDRLMAHVQPVSHSAPAMVFLLDPRRGVYAVRRASGFVHGQTREMSFGRESQLARWLLGREIPIYLIGDDGRLLIGRLSDGERQQIEAAGLVLFLPLRGQDRLAGWVALGERLSGEPYTPDDIAFLAALADQTAMALENAQLLAEARHQAEELIALQQTAVDISAQQDLPVLLRAIVERATRLLSAMGGSVYLADEREPGGERLRMVASHNLGRDYTGLVIERGEGVAGRVALHARPIRVDDYRQFDGRTAALADAPIQAVLGVPLLWHDQVLGVIDVVDAAEGRTFSQEDEWLLSLFASQAAIALRNAQLFGDLERRVVQLDALRLIGEAVDLRRGLDDLLGQIYLQTRRLLQADNFYVALYDEPSQQFAFAYYIQEGERQEPGDGTWSLGTGLSSEVVRRRAPLVTDDYLAECERRGIQAQGTPAKAWLGVPMLAGSEVLGILNVSSFQPGYRYTLEQVQIMSAIADQAASAIERMRLYQEMKARAAELVTLNEVSQTINSTLDLNTVLRLLMNNVVGILDVEAGSLLLVDEETNDLVFRVVLGEHGAATLPNRRLPMGKGIVGNVAQSGQAEIINDVQSDPRWNPEVDKDTGMVTRAILCVPMISRERVIGVIEAVNHRDGTPFRDSEAALLVAFAAQGAVAIENARLYTMTDQALARRVEELSTMQRIDRELNVALDFDHVMDMTVDWALRVTGASIGVIGLVTPDRRGIMLLASRGYPPDSEPHRSTPWPVNRGIAGRVIRTGEAILIADVTQDPDYFPALAETRSELAVPIRREETVIGLVNVESPQPGAFDEEHLAFLRRLADHAAIAIENARLYRESQRWAEEMALLYDISLTISSHLALNDVLEAVYTRIREVWHPPVFYIALYDQADDALDFTIYVDREKRMPRFRHRLAEKAGLSAWIVRNRQPVLIPDIQAGDGANPVQGIPIGDLTRSWLGVPLVAGDEMVGVMAVQDYQPNAFGEDHKRFLSTIASEVAIAIDNARLYQETQQRLRELSVLFDTSAALSVTLDLSVVLDVIASQVVSILGADGCSISRWDREQNTLVTMLDYSLEGADWEPDAKGNAYPLAEYPASQQVLTTRQPLAIRASDPEADPAELRLMTAQGARFLLMVPMVVRDEAVGLLEPVLIQEDREFTTTDIGLVQTIANQAAAALENARLYEGVREADRAKSEFVDFVAHELKQPMTSIQGYAKMLSMGISGEMTPMQRQFVQVITSNVDRMGKLVNDLLEISRLEAGRTTLRLAPVQFQEVVDETVTNIRTEIEARQHTLEVNVPDDLPPVLGDRERLVQILTNLLSNAYKYTPNGGTIRITVDGRSEPDTPPNQLLVTVSDTGIGMSPQELAHLEEKFFRSDHPLVREQPGTGLGVSITRRLVSLHGGELSVESEVGKGSTFRFTVPLAAES